jgi:O-antigen/teichoic acid export membrane protein
MEFKKGHVKKSLSNQILSAVIATFISAIINFISIPLVTKFFTQSEYGTISLFISYQNIFLSIVYLGMDQSMSRFFFEPLGKNSSKSLSTICLGISSLGFIMVSIFILINREKISYSIINEYAIWTLFCSLIYILSQMVLRYLNVISRLQKNAIGYAVQAVGITIVTKISYVLAALVNPTGKCGIMVLCGSSFMLAVLMLCLKGKRSFSLKADTSVPVLKELFKFGLPQIPVFLLNNANNSLPQLAMNIYVSREIIGIYANAISITSILIIVQNSVNVFWAPYVYENYKTEQKNIIKVHHCVSYLMFIATLLVCVFSDFIYFLLVDKSYWESKSILPVLLISPLCYTISETLGIGFKIAKKSYWNIVVYASSFLTNWGLCYLLVPRGGILGAACSVAVSALVMLILKAVIGEKYYKCSDSSIRLILSFICYGFAIIPFVFFSQKSVSFILEILGIVLISALYHKEAIYLVKSAIALLKQKFLSV